MVRESEPKLGTLKDDLFDIPGEGSPSTFSENSVADHDSDEDSDVEEHRETPPQIIPLKKINAKRPAPEEVLPTKRKKRNTTKSRVQGGQVPTFKPISVDYDSEDALLIDMKQKGHSNEDIAKRLVEEGRTKYDPRSIASRWNRIRKKIQAYEEKLLDEELTDWHVGEDDALRQAIEEADKKVEAEIEKIKMNRFTYTAQELNQRLDRPRFSARACKERSEALENGTARCPPELDSDPESRQREREQRLIDFKQRKKEEEDQAAAELAEKKRLKKEGDTKRQAAKQRKEAGALIRAQKRKEDQEYKQAKAEASEQLKQQRKDALEAARAWRKYNEAKHRVFMRLLKKLRAQADARKRQVARINELADFPDAFSGTGQPGKSRFAVKNTREEAQNFDFSATLAEIDGRAHQLQGQAEGIRAEEYNPTPTIPGTDDDNVAYNMFGKDPRNFCTLDELHDILRDRQMLLHRQKENKEVILGRIRDEDERLTYSEVQDLLRERGCSTGGTREILLRRFAESDAMRSRRYKRRYEAYQLDDWGRKIDKGLGKKGPKPKWQARYSATKQGNMDIKKTPTKRTSLKRTPAKKNSVKNTPARKISAKRVPATRSSTRKSTVGKSAEYVMEDDEEDDELNLDDYAYDRAFGVDMDAKAKLKTFTQTAVQTEDGGGDGSATGHQGSTAAAAVEGILSDEDPERTY